MNVNSSPPCDKTQPSLLQPPEGPAAIVEQDSSLLRTGKMPVPQLIALRPIPD